MRRPRAGLRRTAVLLLLALRTGQRTVGEEGGLRRPRGLREGEVGSPASDGRLPSEGGAGVRPTEGADRGPRRGAYLHLEVQAAGARCRDYEATRNITLSGWLSVFTRCIAAPRPA